MSGRSLFQQLFRYKGWANRQILEAVAALSDPSIDIERTNAIRILNHTRVIDRIFQANLQRQDHSFTALNSTDTPQLSSLARRIEDLDGWYIRYVEALDELDFPEPIAFAFVDGTEGCMTRAEMLAHVINHGSYHRGAIGRILTELGLQPPRDVLTNFIHSRR
jgi:uncharacterized damage-inducible protein DinB